MTKDRIIILIWKLSDYLISATFYHSPLDQTLAQDSNEQSTTTSGHHNINPTRHPTSQRHTHLPQIQDLYRLIAKYKTLQQIHPNPKSKRYEYAVDRRNTVNAKLWCTNIIPLYPSEFPILHRTTERMTKLNSWY